MAKEKKDSVVKSAIYFASGTLVSRILGLVRDALLVAIFNKTILDAWYAAFRLPNVFRRLFGEGAFSAGFIPSYIEYKERNDDYSRAHLTTGVLGLLLLILFPFTVAMTLSMDWIVPVWLGGKGFAAIPGKLELTVTMAKIMFPFLILMSLFAYFMALLNAHKKFLITSLAPCCLNLAIIFACVWSYQTQEISGITLSWAVMVGGTLQFLILLPSIKPLQIPYDWSWKHIFSKPVKKVLSVFLPTLLGLGIIQIMSLINTNFASYLPEGAVTHIYLADRLLEFPLSLISVSMGTALLPTLSEKLSGNNLNAFKNEFLKNMRALLFLCLPAGVGLWMISLPLTRLMFERGEFGINQSIVVAQLTQVYAFTLLGASVARLLSQAFYAGKDTKTPALASLMALICHIALAPKLMAQWGVVGLVISTSLVTFVNAGFLVVRLHFVYGTFEYIRLGKFILKCLLASAFVAMSCYLAELVFSNQQELLFSKLNITLLLHVLLAVGLSMGSYFMISHWLGIEEATTLSRKLLKRFKR